MARPQCDTPLVLIGCVCVGGGGGGWRPCVGGLLPCGLRVLVFKMVNLVIYKHRSAAMKVVESQVGSKCLTFGKDEQGLLA